jgi:hypothetical protein
LGLCCWPSQACKSFKEIQETAVGAYSLNSLKKTQIYKSVKAVRKGKSTVDQRQKNRRMKVRSPDIFIIEIAA